MAQHQLLHHLLQRRRCSAQADRLPRRHVNELRGWSHPRAEVQHDWYVVDASGKTFATPTDVASGLPRVSATSVEGGLAAIKLFTELPKSFSENIERMSAARIDNFLIYGEFAGLNLRIIWGDGADTDLKVEVIDALLQRDENKNLRMIDVSAPHAPIVK